MKYAVLIGILIIFGTSCQKQETVITPTVVATSVSDEHSLTFDAIDQQYTERWMYSRYGDVNPAMVVIMAVEDVGRLDEWVPIEQQEQLQQLNFDDVFALALFQGIKGSTRYNIWVERIEYTNGIVSVFAQFIEPEPETEVGATETSPYHIVQVSKPVDWEEKITFNLVVEGAIVAFDLVN